MQSASPAHAAVLLAFLSSTAALTSRDQLWGRQKSARLLIAYEQTSVMPRAETHH